MRRPQDYIYYIGGTLCLVLSAFLLFQSGFISDALTNRAYINNPARTYRDYYYSDIPLHRNDLRQAAAFLPIYSITEKDDVARFLTSFALEEAILYEDDEYFLLRCEGGVELRIYRFLDKLVYSFEPQPSHENNQVSIEKAEEIARNFVKRHLFLTGGFDTTATIYFDGYLISFFENLGKIPNKAFPTTVLVDGFGNVVAVEHFYFEYEELLRADLLTAAEAAAHLPRNRSGRGRINNVELVYVFADSILQPAYIFRGVYENGEGFVHVVNGLKFE